ncbi:MAG: hypothetical protein JSR56_06145 [Proteobacteria bacterium]|nr:hypothetical protein [Pseudomonadota bacterium]
MTKQQRQTILASRPAAMVLALSLVAGLSAPFVMLPPVRAAAIVPSGTTELSAAPVDQTLAVPPNIAITFDDSGSMNWTRLGDAPPWTTKAAGGLYFKTMDWGTGGNQGSGTSGGPWRCANVIDSDNLDPSQPIRAMAMNGVYYNPDVTYTPPTYADGTSFPNADSSLTAVWVDGIAVNRPLSPAALGSVGYNNNPDLDYPNAGSLTNIMGTKTSVTDNRWQCGTGSGSHEGQSAFWNGTSPMDGLSHTLSDGTTVTYPANGPYYYRLKKGIVIAVDTYGNPTRTGCTAANCDGLHTLYNASNWEAVPVPASQYQNFANWYAYYRTRNQMARSALSRAFGSPTLSAKTANGGYGSIIRVAWQNLYTSDTFTLQTKMIISSLMDASGCDASNSTTSSPNIALIAGTSTTAPPGCFRSAFFNWIFQVPALNGTPTRSALARAGYFFERGGALNTTIPAGDLHDPYWQPPQNGAYDAASNPGNELYCRQNFSLLLTDGLWNGNSDGPAYSTLTLPTSAGALPDGVTVPNPGTAGVSSLYAPVHDGGDAGYASLSDITYNYWATDLRPDLYLKNPDGSANTARYVQPYLPDTYTGLFGSAGNVTLPIPVGTNPDGTPNYNLPAEEYFNPNNDPASWPHMSDFMVGLGVIGQLNYSENTDCKSAVAADQDACNLRMGTANSSGSTGWPTPNGSGSGIAANIDDTWHSALAGRGQFFSAGNPQQLVDQLSEILSSISARAATPEPAAVNASVATVGSLSFNVGHGADWSGVFQAVILNTDGTIGGTAWDAGSVLDATAPASRNIYTDVYNSGTLSSLAFTAGNATSLDTVEQAQLMTPSSTGTNDTPANRIAYLTGDKTHEADGTYRKRKHLLGAIIHSQPVYVSYPSSDYYDTWPSGSPEIASGAQSYDTFVSDYATRAGTVYVGANDGMLHAFNAPAPTCTTYVSGTCTVYNYGTNPGQEDWAFVPRAVYANLGNLTSVTNFRFRPTVDATPVTRDVFFSDKNWHTILAGGVGVGGRGVYALDITGTSGSSTPATGPNSVLWEFDSDMTSLATGCTTNIGTACIPSDLGYTVSQPNIGRLATGNWVVIVPNGYFPDCSQPDIPTPDKTSCGVIAAQAPKDSSGNPYSALFVMDAQTGKMIAELKTPTNIPLADGKGNVTSFGLATPVMGDYNNDQIDDVAFAGDLQGNLWRFDLRGTSPSAWTVTLVYQGLDDSSGNQGLQPITTMPRLFPDPATNRFMVVFGTGKYLGAADNGNNAVQTMMGVRDVPGTTYTQPGTVAGGSSNTLTQDYLHETIAPATLPSGGTNPNAGATLRCVTGSSTDTCAVASASRVNTIPAPGSAGGGGWFINLYTTTSTGVQNDQGERVVVSPGAIFASNTVVFETLLTGTSGSDPCNPSTQGAVMALDAVSGAPAGVSSLGGWPIVGARINNARTSGSLPIVSALGGGQAYLPGLTIAPGKNPLSIDAPIWRRREWSKIQPNQ